MANVGPPSPTPGKRDPRTLGNDDVATPTGTPSPAPVTENIGTSQRISQRAEDFDEVSGEMLATLRSLSEQMRGIRSVTFEEFRKNTRGNPFVQFRRAMDPDWDRNLRQQYNVSQTAQMVTLASQMSQVVAQFRQSNPHVDAIIEGMIKRESEALDAHSKLVHAQGLTEASMEIHRRNNNLPDDPAAVEVIRRETLSQFMAVPSQQEILDNRIRLSSVIRNMPLTEADRKRFPGFEAAVDAGLKDQEEKRNEKIMRAGGKKNYTAQFMDPKKLLAGYLSLVSDETELLTNPMHGVPRVIRDPNDLTGAGVVSNETAKLPISPEISDTARMFALQRFKEWVAYNVDPKFVDRAVAVLEIPGVVQDAEAMGDRPPEFWGELRNDVREMTLINLRALASVEADSKSIRPQLPQNQ